MRICSFLPGGTEIAGFLGLTDRLVGATFECDFPPEARLLPRVVESRFNAHATPPAEIDRLVGEALRKGESLYRIDEEKVLDLKPDLILAQDLCEVCAPSGNDAVRLMSRLPKTTQVLYLSPQTLPEILEDILKVGRAAGIEPEARRKVSELEETLRSVRERASRAPRRKVFLMEWLDPPFCAGHWLPEMVEIAGGEDPLGMPGRKSRRIGWDSILAADPEMFIAMPCGYHLEDAAASAREQLGRNEDFFRLKACRNGEIYVVDADSYFVRPGPRVVQGVMILAELLHPRIFSGESPAGGFLKLEIPAPASAARK